MRDRRRENRALSVAHMVRFIFQHHRCWYEDYMVAHSSAGLHSLSELCRRFAYRHGFSRRTATQSAMLAADMATQQKQFCLFFWELYSQLPPSMLINVDETGICIDMPPKSILAEKGKSAAIDKCEKTSGRMTAVLAVRSNGDKLPIMFILKAKPGGTIEQRELDQYPAPHTYILGCKLIAIPTNCTSVIQPLDVGVMGPFKAALRRLWLEEDEKLCESAAEKRHRAIRRAIKAWANITQATVRSSFIKALPKPTHEPAPTFSG
ncbi:hypothetical protein ACHHYP_20866 [Achlya hypogyna]|uniref:DDE-1 domain-containing protein n=1 Tax=Achlya hypogyna TaxID=1202772 RepID=A0A1V9Y4J5_ACHHY|nr:hypothetical protein ACHHYP_20866 [Achlya hypogyna]